eukprot:CAMPEP_0194222776 /NCGR_PEP_ID=MMETSP0156-20130528/33740_1 /TAXON_ID=33649 /ORGANISM="Thalassionema nitzschioides, Strain L26-B" /LENGTH=359 /DNA_ID=CAMNT_0038953703 /DNA_START=63 /DNA_END=1142 /DNA_ORIENTATION=+
MSDEEPPEYERPYDEMNRWIIFGIAAVGLAVLVPILSKVKRTRGRSILSHGIFVALACVLLSPLVPEEFQDIVFSEGGVLVVGSLVPIYSSIVAVCTFGESDDEEWLCYWIINGCFTYSTEFIDTIADHVPFVANHWYEMEFFITLWLLLPWTDGSSFVYDSIFVPFLVPMMNGFNDKIGNGKKIQALILTAVNSSYLGLVWWIFMMMPEEARRFVTVVIGTVYPIIASVAALSHHEGNAETFWLTYWSCFSILFVAMDYLEELVGGIPGFYSLILVATVYLFLPMFQGANVVFRRVLVPLTGQYEAMLLRDTLMLKREMEASIPKNLVEAVKTKAAQVLLMDNNKGDDAAAAGAKKNE